MNQFKEPRFRAQRPQTFDNAEAETTTAMYRQYRKVYSAPGWSSSYKMTSASAATFCRWRNRLFFPFSNANRWDTHLITRFEFIFRLNMFCSPALRLYAKYGKSYFGTPFNWVRKSYRYVASASSAVIATTFYGWSPVFMVGDSN